MCALEASRDLETGQEASRAAPVPGPMVEQGARAAMAGEGIRASGKSASKAEAVDTAPASTAGSLPPPQKKARQIAFEGPALEDTLGAQGLRSACKGLALEGTLGAQARHSAFEGLALEGTLGAQARHSAFEGLALKGTLGAQALHSVCEGPALGLSEQLLAGLPYALSAGLPYFLPAGLTYSLPSAWESRGRRRACIG